MRHDSRLIRIAGQTVRHRQSAISKLSAGRRCRRGQPNASGAAVRKRSWTEAGPDRMEAAAVADGSRSRRSMEVRIAGQLRGIRRVNLGINIEQISLNFFHVMQVNRLLKVLSIAKIQKKNKFVSPRSKQLNATKLTVRNLRRLLWQ